MDEEQQHAISAAINIVLSPPPWFGNGIGALIMY
jgi:hypothetical protein